jgi:hypothetical protein
MGNKSDTIRNKYNFSFSLYRKRHFGKTKKQRGREREREAQREREGREMRKGLFRFLVFVWNIIPLASAAVFFNPLHASFPDLPAKPGNSSSFFWFSRCLAAEKTQET